jgi:ribose transport system permease protein
VLSAAVGAIALELLFTLLTVQEVESTWRDTVQGVIIIVAVAVAARGWQAGRRPRRSSTPSDQPRADQPRADQPRADQPSADASRSPEPSTQPHSTQPSQGANTGDK